VVVIRKNAVVGQAKDVRNANCPRACMKGEGKRSAGWNISITLDDVQHTVRREETEGHALDVVPCPV